MNFPVAEDLVGTLQRLSLARSTEDVVAIVQTAARRLVGADGASFVLRDGDFCHYVDEDATAPLWKGRRFPLETCVTGMVMRDRASIAIGDISRDRRVPIALYRPTFVRSLLAVPIRSEDPIGAIAVYWAATHETTPDERSVLETLANSTSVALSNVELQRSLATKVAELERASELKEQFLLTLSHELRTPMTAILGWSELMLEGLEPDVLKDAAAAIHRNAKTEMRLISDLLDTTQFLCGRLKLEVTELDLNEVVAQGVTLAGAAAAKRDVNLTFEGAGSPVIGDADRVLQIVNNLLTNALKFTPAGGHVRVELRDDGGYVLLSVTDDGEGIDQDTLPKIFDRFQTQSGRLNRQHGGLGLGLALVKSLVEAHRGRVTALSAGPGRGARFEVRLPRAPHRTNSVDASPRDALSLADDAFDARAPHHRPRTRGRRHRAAQGSHL